MGKEPRHSQLAYSIVLPSVIHSRMGTHPEFVQWDEILNFSQKNLSVVPTVPWGCQQPTYSESLPENETNPEGSRAKCQISHSITGASGLSHAWSAIPPSTHNFLVVWAKQFFFGWKLDWVRFLSLGNYTVLDSLRPHLPTQYGNSWVPISHTIL